MSEVQVQVDVLLSAARAFADKGDESYRQAAVEIRKAKDIDPALTSVRIASQVGRSPEWVRNLLAWHEAGAIGSPYSEDSEARVERATKRFLRETGRESLQEVFETVNAQRDDVRMFLHVPSEGVEREARSPLESVISQARQLRAWGAWWHIERDEFTTDEEVEILAALEGALREAEEYVTRIRDRIEAAGVRLTP